MFKVVFNYVLLLLILLLHCSGASSQTFERWKHHASNLGTTGLLEMPNAYVMPDWHLRVNYGFSRPYVYHSVSMTYLPSLEIVGRYTRIMNVSSGLSNLGDYKDKAIDFKWQVLREREWLPAIAIGAYDIHGTGLFTSRYLVASKFWGISEFTLGYGQGRLGQLPITGSRAESRLAENFVFGNEKKGKVFGGARIRISDQLTFLGEYDSTRYEIDSISPILTRPSSQANWGVRYMTKNGFLLGLHYLRGEELGFSLSVDAALKPFQAYEPAYKASAFMKNRVSSVNSNKKLSKTIHQKLKQRGFSINTVMAGTDYLWIEALNGKYLSDTKAFGRIARIASELSPASIKTLYVSLQKNGGTPLTLSIPRQQWQHYLDDEVSLATLTPQLNTTAYGQQLKKNLRKNDKKWHEEKTESKPYSYGIAPKVQLFLNDGSGFLSGRLSLMGKFHYTPWPLGFFKSSVRIPVYSNVPNTTSPNGLEPKLSVRSDITKYLDKTPPRLETFGFDQIIRLPLTSYFRGSAGVFEYAYTGIEAEWLTFFFDGRLAIGLEATNVQKRQPRKQFTLLENQKFQTRFAKIYYNLSKELGIDLIYTTGKFLAGDRGRSFRISRTYEHFTLGAWYTVTNTEIFESSQNKGYRDLGIFFSFPFRVFSTVKTNRIGYNSLSPWTRDTGQSAGKLRDIYGTTHKSQPYHLNKNISNLAR